DPDLVTAVAAVALKRVQGHQAVTLRVSRYDCDRVRKAIADINPGIVVKDDVTLERGDFMIDTAQTHLDGRVSSQVETLGRLMLDEQRERTRAKARDYELASTFRQARRRGL